MTTDRMQRIADRIALGRRAAAAPAVRAARSVRTGALTVLFAIISPLSGVTVSSVTGWLIATVFPVREPAHRPVADRSVRARAVRIARPTPRRALAAGAALLAGVFVATGLAAGTYAFLNAQASTPAVSIKSGNLAVVVQYGSGVAGSTATLPTTAWASMLPGDVVAQQFTISSTGSAGANFTVRLSAATAWEIRLAAGTCPATPLTGTPLTTTAVAAGSLAGGTSSPVCVQATLPANAAASVAGTSPTFSILIDGTQVPS